MAGIRDEAAHQAVKIRALTLEGLQDMSPVEHHAAGNSVAPVVPVRDAQNLGHGQGRGAGRADSLAVVYHAMEHDDSLNRLDLGYRLAG